MKTVENGISVVKLGEMFDLEVSTGVLRWRERPPHHFVASASRSAETISKKINSQHAGKVAFTSRHQLGYLRAEIGGHLIQAHRVVFALVHGFWPNGSIDHINGDPSDNRPANLRDVTHAENMRNQKLKTTNVSGRVGVQVHKPSGKWQAAIRVNGKTKYLGLFKEIEAATAARHAAEVAHGFHTNHGRTSP